MSTQSEHGMSTQSEHQDTVYLTDRQIQEMVETEEEAQPRELESAFLTISMFVGLVIFGVGCMMFLW